MSRLGIRIDLLTYGHGDEVDIPRTRTIRIPRFFRTRPVKVGPSFAKAFYDLWLFFWAIGLMMRNRYDFVQAHEESAFFAIFLARLFRARFVYDMHSSLPEQLSHFRYGRSRLLVALFRAMERVCLRWSDIVITISPALADYARSRMPDPHRHFLIENSVVGEVRLKGQEPGGDGSDLEWVEETLDRRDPTVAYAGTLEPYQGIDLLLEAFTEIVSRWPNAMLVVIGGTRQQVERYRKLTSELGLDGNCVLIGSVGQSHVRKLLSKADVLVSPRRGGTNTPLKVYEQLSLGIPLVATRIVAHTQVLDESISVLVDPTPAGLAAGLERALSDPSASREIGRRARVTYEQRYGWDAYLGRMGEMLSCLGHHTAEYPLEEKAAAEQAS